MRIPARSTMHGRTLRESQLGDALGLRVVLIVRNDDSTALPESDEQLRAGDRLLASGQLEQLQLLQGLQELRVEKQITPQLDGLESQRVGMSEVVLSPRTTLAGQTIRQLRFRERFGLSVLAVWRNGKPHRTSLRDFEIQLGDALLLYGPREKLQDLGRDPDFIVLTASAQEIPRMEKSRWSILIMGGMIVTAVAGWIPIYIAAVAAAALMIVSGCLTMQEAYRNIEWKAVFLIAGLLPLGLALNNSGAASMIAGAVVSVAGPWGPMPVVAALMLVTFVATSIIPTAALVVLMAPIVLSTAQSMGVSPSSMMMATAIAASSSFTSPVSHPANVMIMGPGGYRFIDYVKVGAPLTLVVLVTVLLVLPVFWPM
jgi:di/tricarboxylate transporter